MHPLCTVQDIRMLGTIMTVCAHPDDETFIAAGVIAAAVKNGQKVICVTYTHGEAGVYDPAKYPPGTLGEVRTRELQQALQELGVKHYYLLNYADGGCASVSQKEAVAVLGQFIQIHQPDTILTFGPDGLTGHSDHQAVSTWVAECAANIVHPPRILHVVVNPDSYEGGLRIIDGVIDIFFNISQPPLMPKSQCALAFDLPPDLLDQKCRALAAMSSQSERFFAAGSPEQVRRALQTEYFVDASPNRE